MSELPIKSSKPRKKAKKPWKEATPLTRQLYEREGFRIEFVEQCFISMYPRPRITKKDLWGIGDFLAFKPGKHGAHLVNSCVRTEVDAHFDKFRLLVVGEEWLQSGNKIAIVGWQEPKKGEPQAPAYIRQMKIEDYVYADGEHCDLFPPRDRTCRACKWKFKPHFCARGGCKKYSPAGGAIMQMVFCMTCHDKKKHCQEAYGPLLPRV